MMRRRFYFLLFSIVFLCSSQNDADAGWRQKKDRELYKQIELFTDAITILQSNYVEEVESKELIYGALKGMLASLDAHSQFMDPQMYEDIKVETEGEFGGLGIEISIRDDLLMIISPIAGTPAEAAGLLSGDKIVKIDGELTKDTTLMEAVRKLRGEPGTKVTVTILREDEGTIFDVTIIRDIIKIESIKAAEILDGGIGYVRIVEFQENTAAALEQALSKLEVEGMDSLILDLRNNPGGLLDSAVKVTDMFMPKGDVIVSTKGRIRGQNLVFKSHGANAHLGYPLVVLINGGSASGSEIVAGAIQDYNIGVLLGTKSFGKGSVQTVIPLKDGSALRLTTSKYFTPSGRSIHGEGIIPDVIVKQQKIKQVDLKKEKKDDVFEKLEGKEEEEEKESVKDIMEYDTQLSRAVDLIKGIRVYRKL